MAKKFKDLAAPVYDDPERARRVARHRDDLEAEHVAYRLAELRSALGIDQVELANRLGISQPGVSKLERSADPQLSTLRKISEALGGTLRIEFEIDNTVYPLVVGN